MLIHIFSDSLAVIQRDDGTTVNLEFPGRIDEMVSELNQTWQAPIKDWRVIVRKRAA